MSTRDTLVDEILQKLCGVTLTKREATSITECVRFSTMPDPPNGTLDSYFERAGESEMIDERSHTFDGSGRNWHSIVIAPDECCSQMIAFQPKSYWSVWLYTSEPPHYKHIYLSIEDAKKAGIRIEDAKEFKFEGSETKMKRELHWEEEPVPRGYARWYDNRVSSSEGWGRCIWLPFPLYILARAKNYFMLWFYRNLHATWYKFCRRRGWKK